MYKNVNVGLAGRCVLVRGCFGGLFASLVVIPSISHFQCAPNPVFATCEIFAFCNFRFRNFHSAPAF